MGCKFSSLECLSIIEVLRSNSFQAFFCFASGLFCCLPLFLGLQSNIEDHPLRLAITTSKGFAYTCVASIALSIPLFIDVLIDISTSIDKTSNSASNRLKLQSSGTARFNFLNISERLLILLGIIVLPLIIFLPKSTPNLSLIYVCLFKCQQCWIGGTVALSLSRYDKHYFSNDIILASLTSFSIGLVSSAFTDNILPTESTEKLLPMLDMVTLIFILMPCVSFLVLSTRWLILVYYRASRWSNILFCYSKLQPPTTPNTGVDHTFFPMVYTVSGICIILALCVLSGVSYRIQSYTEINLLQINTPYLIFVILVSILSLRMVKYEVVQGLYALIDSKKSYVRYISHELRTPLNSAFLGLKLLTDDLKGSRSPQDTYRNEILSDVNVACRTTVDILNDLLCFDKLESGILEVHKHEVPVLSFLADCVGMFSAQAREGDITMSVVTGADERSDSQGDVECMPLLDDDTVFIDRFKMDQVIRNLVSNALKFTPRGGAVTLTAAFVPKAGPPPQCLSRESAFDSSYLDFYTLGRSARFNRGSPNATFKRVAGPKIYIEEDLEGVEAGGKSPTPTEDTKNIEGKLVIVVKDTGAGMLPEDFSRLFKEIVQFKPEVLQAGGGSGLGLWITKGIMDLHGGTVSVHSEGLGLGSSFSLELSMERKVCTAFTAFESEQFINTAPREGALYPEIRALACATQEDYDKTGALRVLIVDDSPLNRKMLLRTFRAAGHECDEAMDGLEAVEKIKEIMASPQRCYSVVLMDFVMPNMDGPTATRFIRSLGYTAPIFGATGNMLSFDVDHFLENGVDKVFAKPLDMCLFNEAIKLFSRPL